MSRRGRSLRFKLTLWFVLVFSLIQATLVGAVLLFRQKTIRATLDNELADSAKAMVDNIVTAGVELTDGKVRDLVPAGAGFVLYAIRDPEGVVLAKWNVPQPALLPFSPREIVPAGPVGPVITTLGPAQAGKLVEGESRLRIVTLPFRVGDALYFFQGATRDQVLERLLGPLDFVVLGVPLGVLAAMIAAWVIGGRAVAPIQRLSRAVMELSPRSLGGRLRIRASHSEIARLEDELNSALERMEEGYKAQEQFISNVSHELKTPIAVLLTEAQVAKLGQRSLEKSYAFIDKAEREMKRLGSLVESLLILARTDMNSHDLEESVSISDVVLECIQHCRFLAERQGIRLLARLVAIDDPSDPVVHGDPELLQIMVENLIRNAIRHSPQGAPVSIEARCREDMVEVAVRDEGPGIPDDYLNKVFERGVRVPESIGRSDGTGLGLAIASNVAQLHRGKITVEKNGEGGCSFVVSLPLAKR